MWYATAGHGVAGHGVWRERAHRARAVRARPDLHRRAAPRPAVPLGRPGGPRGRPGLPDHAPVVELSVLVLVPLGLLAGALDPAFAWRFLLVAYAYAALVSLVAVAIEELSFHRYRRWSDLGAVLAAAVLENLGYRQLTAVWRLQGSWAALRRRPPVWGTMVREGFVTAGSGAARVPR